jgi:hypothetical protein
MVHRDGHRLSAIADVQLKGDTKKSGIESKSKGRLSSDAFGKKSGTSSSRQGETVHTRGVRGDARGFCPICDNCGAENPDASVHAVQTRDIFVRFSAVVCVNKLRRYLCANAILRSIDSRIPRFPP